MQSCDAIFTDPLGTDDGEYRDTKSLAAYPEKTADLGIDRRENCRPADTDIFRDGHFLLEHLTPGINLLKHKFLGNVKSALFTQLDRQIAFVCHQIRGYE